MAAPTAPATPATPTTPTAAAFGPVLQSNNSMRQQQLDDDDDGAEAETWSKLPAAISAGSDVTRRCVCVATLGFKLSARIDRFSQVANQTVSFRFARNGKHKLMALARQRFTSMGAGR
ncbi:hypothetical protein ACLKA7_006456 [Drosophila subpalustris]